MDVRILAATNRDLRREVDAGRFRQDLYYRLNVVAVALPPLRERIEDIPLLATFFLKRFAAAEGRIVRGFTPEAMDRLLKYPWPGNVRELENTVERAMLLLAGEYIGERELPPGMIGNGERDDEIKGDLDLSEMTLDELEQAAVREAMRATGGNKSAAARRLGVTRKTLKAKLQKMDFEPGT